MATYVNDLRLTELATGEGSGTWGTTTNLNLELIGEALGYGTQDCFASDADSTTTVADGASDPARAMYFKVTSSATLTATRTLTIAPNTVSRVMLIENATTGSQSIAISQGSGGNVTIASGQVKMVYLDGAGSGGAVVDALADLELGTITVADLTATTADINGGTIDGTTIATSDITVGAGKTLDVSAGTFTVANDQISGDAINGGTATPTNLTVSGTTSLAGASTTADITFGDNDKAIFGAGSDLQIYHDGSNSYIKEAGTGYLYLQGSDRIYLQNADAAGTYARFVSGAEATLYHNNAAKLATTATGIDVTGTVTADGVDLGVTTDAATVSTTASDYQLQLGAANSTTGDIGQNISFGSSGTTTASINSYDAGASAATGLAFFTGTSSTLRRFLDIGSGGDIQFYENTGTTPKFFWDASAEALGLGTTSPAAKLDVAETDSVTYSSSAIQGDLIVSRKNSAGTVNQVVGLQFDVTGYVGSTTGIAGISAIQTSSASSAALAFQTRDSGTIAERMRIDSSGNVVIGATTAAQKLHVSSAGAVTRALIENTNNAAAGAGIQMLVKNGATTVGNGTIRIDNADNMQFFNIGGERARIDSSGNLLVGTTDTTPFDSSTEQGTVVSDGQVQIAGTSTPLYVNRQASAGHLINMRYNGVEVGSISTNGSTTAYNTSSDYRLKDVDGPITNSGAYIDALKPVQGSWKADGSRFIGLIAHEVQEVSETPIATGEKDGEEMQAMDYSAPELIANLIAEIQSLRARVHALESK